MPQTASKSTALKFIVLLGIVSLFADVTYEGARSIIGPYLSLLGASGTVVGVTVGFGELVGYAFRFVSGYISDKTQRYWLITFVGYIINLLAVPLLAIAGNWYVAATLIVLERFGKSIRVPARDTMLSYASKHTGRGWGFGLHEFLDQLGAVLGPLVVSAVLFYKQSYRLGFAFLAIPAACSLIALTVAKLSFPRPQEMEPVFKGLATKGFGKSFWIYLTAVGFVALGYADFALIAYHFKNASTVPDIWIALLYAIAMATAGLAALIMGKVFDVRGINVLAIITGFSALFAPMVFWGGFYWAIAGMVIWGIGMGAHESIMRAVVAFLVPPEKRGRAYGVLNLGFGIFWFVGSSIIGLLYDISLIGLVVFSVISQIIAIPLILMTKIK